MGFRIISHGVRWGGNEATSQLDGVIAVTGNTLLPIPAYAVVLNAGAAARSLFQPSPVSSLCCSMLSLCCACRLYACLLRNHMPHRCSAVQRAETLHI